MVCDAPASYGPSPAQGVNVTFKQAPQAKKDKGAKQLMLQEAGEDDG